MELKYQVCSLNLAREIKNLGFYKTSTFVYENPISLEEGEGWLFAYKLMVTERAKIGSRLYPAYTVAELGEMLPKRLKNHWKISSMYKFKRGTYVDLTISYNERTKEWIVSYYGDTGFGESDKNIYFHGEIAKTEADARAKMLIYLLKNNLITL